MKQPSEQRNRERSTCLAWGVFICDSGQKWGVAWLATGVSDYIWKSLNWMAERLWSTKIIDQSLFESWIGRWKGDIEWQSLFSLDKHFVPKLRKKNDTVLRKIPASSKVELYPAQVSKETNTVLPDRYASTVLISCARGLWSFQLMGFLINPVLNLTASHVLLRIVWQFGPQGISRRPLIG